MKKPMLKIYGERNTGTNYLSELIELNLDVNQIIGVIPKSVVFLLKILPAKELVPDIYFYLTFSKNLGWKHSLVKSPDELKKYYICSNGLSFVTLTKNPYSWLLSLYRRPYHHQYWRERPDFETFLTSPWRTLGRDNAPSEFSSPVELWNQKNCAYIRLPKLLPALNIRYEDLLADPEGIIETISQTFSYNWKHSTFTNFAESTKDGNKDFSFYRKYYLEEEWKAELPLPSIKLINEQLDDEVLEYFHYQKLV